MMIISNPMKSVPVESECCEKCSCPGIGFEYQSGAIHTMCSGDFCHDHSCPCHKSVPVEKWLEKLKDEYRNLYIFDKELTVVRAEAIDKFYGDYYVGQSVNISAILSQALQAAVEEERNRIAEAMKRIPIYGSDDYTRGAKEMVELIILAIINKHQ